MRKVKYIYFIVGLFMHLQASGQQIMIDRGIQVNGLWCFPIFGDSLSYRYLPSNARLGLNKDSIPEFSLLRYILEKPNASSINSISEAGGGGIVTFLVLYDTPAALISSAEAALRNRLKNPKITIKGPVVFSSGRYLLVSSILQPSGKTEKEVLGTGEAPVLENSKIAFSFEVDPVKSKLLLENFKMRTPDISLMFELSFSGLTDSYQADLTVDWEEVRKSQSFGAGGSVYFIGADVEVGFDKLMRNNSIKLNTIGSNEVLEGLLTTVYGKLLDLMFKRVEPERVPTDQRGGVYDAISALAGPNGPLGSRRTTGFGLNVSYQLKELQTTGKSTMFFRGRSTVERKHFITFNIGDLYQKHGRDTRMFRDVPLYDPSYKQRAVMVGVDGSLDKEFDRLVESVTVVLKKKHNSGQVTINEIVVNKKNFRDSTGRFKMIYQNSGDTNLLDWLEYEYRTTWKFIGGVTYITEWAKENSAMINLFAPYRRRTIALDGDLEGTLSQNIRVISVKIKYPFFNELREELPRNLRSKDNLAEKGFEVTLPLGRDEVDYEVIWRKQDGTILTKSGKDKYGIIFIDELPK